MIYGVWFMVYGVWCMVYGVWLTVDPCLSAGRVDRYINLGKKIRQFRVNNLKIAVGLRS